MASLLAKPSPLNINLGSDRFSMFNKKAGHPRPTIVDRLNELPVKKVDGTVIYVRDVAYAHEGSPPHRLKGKSEQVVAIEIK